MCGSGVEGDRSRASLDLPARGGLTADFDVAGTGMRVERTIDSLQVDAAAAGVCLHVVGRMQICANVAGTGAQVDDAGGSAGLNRPGTRAGLERSARVSDAKVTGAGIRFELGPAGRRDVV